jgi:hypothetical protein
LNSFENKLIDKVARVAPMLMVNHNTSIGTTLPAGLRSKINLRKKLLRKYENEMFAILKSRIKELDSDIKFTIIAQGQKK